MKLGGAMPAFSNMREKLGQRGAAFLLALGIELLLALLLLWMSPVITPMGQADKPTVFGLDVGNDAPEAPAEKAEARRRPGGRSSAQPKPPVPQPPEPDPPAPLPKVEWPSDIVRLTRNDYARSNIANAPASAAAAAAGEGAEAGESGGGGKPGDSEVVGRAPNGEPLYGAQWHVRPTNAQLAPYIPARARGQAGWGMIACRMVADYRVEDCREVGQGPRGSGYSGAVRQAAWQFRVRPPRVGGVAKIGTWVQIRIDYQVTRE